MTPSEALEQAALEFEQRRAKIQSELMEERQSARSARTDSARRASAVFQEELRARANELLGVVNKLRSQASDLRSEEAA